VVLATVVGHPEERIKGPIGNLFLEPTILVLTSPNSCESYWTCLSSPVTLTPEFITMSNWKPAYSLLIGSLGLVLSANASTLVSTAGQVAVLAAPPLSVALGGLESNTNAYVFQESEFTLESPVSTDISMPGDYTTVLSLTPGTIAAGTPVDVYMLESQPASAPRGLSYRTYQGSLTFNEPILGIIVETTGLRSTDATLGASGTLYPPMTATYSGLELNTPGCHGSTCGNDSVVLSANRETVNFDFVTNVSEVDEIRIITAATPEPGGIALTLLGLLPLMALKSARAARGKRA
jgi:hypothetical protein